MTHPPVCSYEDSDYQSSFWDKGGREYEDRVEAIALRRLLPRAGKALLEIGAGAGRNTPRYSGFGQIILLDFSRTQLEQARERLGSSNKFVFVAGNAYRLPFRDGSFDTATMIRTLHHLADIPLALGQVKNVLQPGGIFILEFANKLNLKSILRYWLRRQPWSPFALEPVEFVKLNFDFHPKDVFGSLTDLDFTIERKLAVSQFRIAVLKKAVPTALLVALDSLLQWTGALWQLTPSVFVRARRNLAVNAEKSDHDSRKDQTDPLTLFKCPECGHSPLADHGDHLLCSNCKRRWSVKDGIYDFREPQ
jgi:ubiquinone/menaquinone biosynthesis C-methylase UbiE